MAIVIIGIALAVFVITAIGRAIRRGTRQPGGDGDEVGTDGTAAGDGDGTAAAEDGPGAAEDGAAGTGPTGPDPAYTGRKPIPSSESGPDGPPQRRSLMSTPGPRAGRSAAEAARTQADGGFAAGSPGPGELPGGGPGDSRRSSPIPAVPAGGVSRSRRVPHGGGIPPGPPAEATAADGSDGGSVVRSSGVMALGTLASRGTGFLRTAGPGLRARRRVGVDRLQQRQHAAEHGL